MKRGFLILFLFGSLNLGAQEVETWVSKGLTYDSMEQPQKAIDCFNKAIGLEPDLAVAWFNRGIARMHLKQYSMAVVDFNKCIFLDTGLQDAYFNRHLAYRYTFNYQFALADIDHFIQRHPADLEGIDSRVDLAIEMKEWEIAKKDLSLLISKAPENASLKIRLAEVCNQSGDYAASEMVLGQLIKEYPNESQFYLSRAFSRNQASNYTSSQEDINVYLLQSPNDAEALKLKADNYFYLKEFHEASLLYLSLLTSDSLNAGLHADYGHCLLQEGNYSKAEEILTKSIRLKGDSPAYAYLGRGIARYNQGRVAEACQDWEKSSMLGEKRAKLYLDTHCK
jgi:tetratricopeptide (TPR) repeat protein